MKNLFVLLFALTSLNAFAGDPPHGFPSRNDYQLMLPEMKVSNPPPSGWEPSGKSEACQYRESCNFSDWHDDWRKEDTARQLVFATLVYMDVRQTLEDLDNPNHVEKNRILGEHPSRKRVIYYSIGGVVLHTGFTWILPKEARAPFQYVSIVLEGKTVYDNYKLGIRVGKRF